MLRDNGTLILIIISILTLFLLLVIAPIGMAFSSYDYPYSSSRIPKTNNVFTLNNIGDNSYNPLKVSTSSSQRHPEWVKSVKNYANNLIKNWDKMTDAQKTATYQYLQTTVYSNDAECTNLLNSLQALLNSGLSGLELQAKWNEISDTISESYSGGQQSSQSNPSYPPDLLAPGEPHIIRDPITSEFLRSFVRSASSS